MKRPAVFLDRDGTVIKDVGYICKAEDVAILPGIPEALERLKVAGFRLVIVTNQSGIGRGYFTVADYESVHHRMLKLLGCDPFDATYFCGDHPDLPTPRRKPGPGMLLEAAEDLGIDLGASWMVGDRDGDLQAGLSAGTRSILVRTGEGMNAKGTSAHFIAKDLAEAAEFILRDSGAS